MDAILQVIIVISLWAVGQVAMAPALLRQPRLSLAAETPSYFKHGANGTYMFGYDIHDPETGNTQFRSEERYQNGTVVGSYGYVDALGRSHRYDYIADDKGYRVISNKLRREPYQAATVEIPSTEAPVVWTRPPKRKDKIIKPLQRRQFNQIQPSSSYLLY